MHKCGTCNTKGRESLGEVIDPICVMAVSYRLYAMVESVMEEG